MERETAIRYMKDHMTNNKAMGLLAQAEFERWAIGEATVKPKYFGGCWIASPKGFTASRRICFFIHPKLEGEDSVETVIQNMVSERGYHTLFSSISRAGLGVVGYKRPIIVLLNDYADGAEAVKRCVNSGIIHWLQHGGGSEEIYNTIKNAYDEELNRLDEIADFDLDIVEVYGVLRANRASLGCL